MQWWEDRVANGLAKAGGGLKTQEQIESELAQDVIIYADPSRATPDDLWPAVWALAATLSRQFSGRVFVRAGLDGPLDAPGPLSARCFFTQNPPNCRLAVGLGMVPLQSHMVTWWGDVRDNRIAIEKALSGTEEATPWAAFALAGYLSYALLSSAAGFPPYKARFVRPELAIGMPGSTTINTAAQRVAVLGLGHLGNAYLALLYFIAQHHSGIPKLLLLDRGEGGGRLEYVNWKTHILLDEERTWEGEFKTAVLAEQMARLGAKVEIDSTALTWGWRKPAGHPSVALLGFDSFEARRMAIESGYEWIVDGGIGTRFDRPRVTWHSLPPDRELGKRLFKEGLLSPSQQIPMDSPLAQNLEDRTNPCGWVTSFHGISAAAPAMGLVAAAYVWGEVLKVWLGLHRPLCGQAYLWSPGISPSSELL